jgi:hypothetical protein
MPMTNYECMDEQFFTFLKVEKVPKRVLEWFLRMGNGKLYAWCGFSNYETCNSKGQFFLLELWWGHNNQQLELDFHPCLYGWKLEEIALLLNLQWIIKVGRFNNLTTKLVNCTTTFGGLCDGGIQLASWFTLVQMVWWYFKAWR